MAGAESSARFESSTSNDAPEQRVEHPPAAPEPQWTVESDREGEAVFEGRRDATEPPEEERPPTNHLGHKDAAEREFRALYPDDYLEPMNRLSVKVEPFSDPRELARRVNPDFETGQPYQRNCADCARCFERGWRGNVEEAAGRAYEIDHARGGLFVRGESLERTEKWAGERFSDVYDSNDLRERLQSAGPGASAIVHSRWTTDESSYGHAYNVVNDRGEIRVVDAQSNQVFPWTEGSIHPGVSEAHQHWAMAWNAKGQRIW